MKSQSFEYHHPTFKKIQDFILLLENACSSFSGTAEASFIREKC
jgi:hypothetical protein